MKKANPHKKYLDVPPKDSTCGCSECSFMKLITLEKILNSLKSGQPEIYLDKEIIINAGKPIKRMMEISEKLGL